jgi:prevent-host-death family protein
MHTMGVSELKAGLSEALSRVKAGEEILVTQHGKPVARLVPLSPVGLDADTERLVRAGILLPPTAPGPLPESFWNAPRTPDPDSLLLKALLEERRTGR